MNFSWREFYARLQSVSVTKGLPPKVLGIYWLWTRADNREDVPEDILTHERELIAAQARNEGKPDHIIEKIVDGRVNSFYQANVLYDQTFVRTEKFEGSIGDMVKSLASSLGENISVNRFERIQVGETAE